MGNSNPSHSCTMSDVTLTIIAEKKDLGVIMDHKLKLRKHTAYYAVKKASMMLGLFRATFTCLDEITVPTICMAMVRPQNTKRHSLILPYYDIKVLERSH